MPSLRGGSTGSWTGCNLKTGRCCMIAFLSCSNFTLPILRPILRLCLSLPTHVPQGYSALFVSRLSGKSKELITMMKARGTAVKKPQVWSPLGLYRHVIISFMTFWPCRTSSGPHSSMYGNIPVSQFDCCIGECTFIFIPESSKSLVLMATRRVSSDHFWNKLMSPFSSLYPCAMLIWVCQLLINWWDPGKYCNTCRCSYNFVQTRHRLGKKNGSVLTLLLFNFGDVESCSCLQWLKLTLRAVSSHIAQGNWNDNTLKCYRG